MFPRVPSEVDVINLSSEDEASTPNSVSAQAPIEDQRWKPKQEANFPPLNYLKDIPKNATIILLSDEESESQLNDEPTIRPSNGSAVHHNNNISNNHSTNTGSSQGTFPSGIRSEHQTYTSLILGPRKPHLKQHTTNNDVQIRQSLDAVESSSDVEMEDAIPEDYSLRGSGPIENGITGDAGLNAINNSFLPNNMSAQGHTTSINKRPIQEDVSDEEDDIIIVDPNEIQKQKFKKTSFEERPNRSHPFSINPLGQILSGSQQDMRLSMNQGNSMQLFRGPAPVQHWGPEHTLENVLIEKQKEVASRVSSIQDEIASHNHMLTKQQEEVTKSEFRKQELNEQLNYVKAERVNLINSAYEDAQARIYDLDAAIRMKSRELFDLDNFIEKCKSSMNSYLKRNQAISEELRSLNVKMFHLKHDLKRLEVPEDSRYENSLYQDAMQNPYHYQNNIVDIDERNGEILRNNLMGFADNVYTNQSDSADLQNLINNIRPDEEEPEDGKGLVSTPPEMSITLLKHQRLGLSWLLRMENLKSKGGILADDMGLGKTVQAIALLLANAPKDDSDTKTTLIIAPVSLLRQWAAEIASKIKPSSQMSVAIYHGIAKKTLSRAKDLLKYDVVLTSFGTLTSEWKKHFKEALNRGDVTKSQNVVPDIKSGGLSYVSPFFDYQNSKFYRVILDEAQAIKNKLSIASKTVHSLRATYRLCMSGTPMQNNVEELYPLLRFLQIRPYNNEVKFRTTFVIPLKRSAAEDDDGEAYNTNPAMKKLRILLGAILLRRTKSTIIDGKPILNLPPKHVTEDNAIMKGDEIKYYKDLESHTKKKAKELLSKTTLDYSNILVLLLRLRQACCHQYLVEIGMLKKQEKIQYEGGEVSDIPNANWEKMFESCMQYSSEVVNMIQREVGDSQDDTQTFSCPICYDALGYESVILFPGCGHMICKNCIEPFFQRFEEGDHMPGQRHARCMTCQSQTVKENNLIDYNMFHKVHLDKLDKETLLAQFQPRPRYKLFRPRSNIAIIKDLIKRDGGKFTPSAKIEECLKLIKKITSEAPDEKIIVFSQFTALFDLMKLVLDHSKINFLQYDGSMSIEDKNATIKEFYQQLDIKVMLLSLRAGNVGLTLTCASHVIIMDPFWNPYVEEQAQDRAYRIGQQREVHVHRLLIEKTVENRIMELQQQKKALVGSALNDEGLKNVTRLGRQELGFLFGLNAL